MAGNTSTSTLTGIGTSNAAAATMLILAWFIGGGGFSLYLTAQYGIMASTAIWSLHGTVVALIVALVTGLHR